MRAKRAADSETRLADLIQPPDANSRGTAFGGKILSMVDKAAGVCAMRHCGKPCVTVAMDRVEFLVPIQVGDFLMVRARLDKVGRTSMTVRVEVYAEDLRSGKRRHTNSCVVTMVAVSPKGKPARVPRLAG